MRKLILVALAVTLVLAGCTAEYQPEQLETYSDNTYLGDYEIVAYPNALQPPAQTTQSDFYEELQERGSLIVAMFDFDEFSVWLAGTPQFGFNSVADAYLLHVLRPMTAAVVRNIDGRYTLVEEAELDFGIQPYDRHIPQGDAQNLLNTLTNVLRCRREGIRD